MHTHMRATKRRFDPGDEKRHKGLGAGSFGPRPSTVPMPGVWAQRAANEELPSSFAEGGRLARYQQLQQLQQLQQQQQRSSGSSPIDDEWASTRAAGSGVSQDSSDAELMPPTRPPKTQEDWVRWALNAGGQAHGLGKSRQSASSVDDVMDHVSSNAATVGGAGSATSSDHYYAGDDDEDQDQENERDSDSEEEEEYDDSIEDDDDDDEDEDPTPVSGAKRGGYGEIVGIAFGGGGSRVTRPTDYLWKGEGGSLLG